MKRIFKLPPNVFFLGLVSFFNDFSNEMITAVLPAFLTVVLGAPAVFLGAMDGVADALASFWRIVSGWLSDKIRVRKDIAAAGYGVSVIVRSLLIFVRNMWQVFAIRLVDRTGKGMRESPRDALLAESVDGKDLGRSFGYQRAMDTMGGVLGPLCAIIFFGATRDYRMLFIVSFLLGILGVASFLFVRESRVKDGAPRAPARRLSFSLKGFPKYFQIFVIAIFVFGLGSMPLSLMLLKSHDIGSVVYIPLMYFVYNTSFAILAIPFGKLADKIGKRKVIAAGFFVAILAYITFALFSNIALIYLGFILFGIYSAMTDGVLRAKASKLVDPAVLAEGEGFLAAALGVSSLLAGVIGGSIWTLFGETAAFTYGAVMMTLGLALFLYWNGFWGHHANHVSSGTAAQSTI